MLYRLTEIGPEVSLEWFLPTSTSFPQGHRHLRHLRLKVIAISDIAIYQ